MPLTYGEIMKKSSISRLRVMTMIAVVIIGAAIYLKKANSDGQNDNKNQLTLLNKTEEKVKKIPVLKALIAKNLEKQNEFAESQVTDQNVLTAERIYTENEINEMTEEKFINLLKDTETRLPKLSDIKKLPEGALHRTPPIIIEAGRNLGVIKEVLKAHESFERQAANFYKTCAKNEQGVTPVRALCLTNLIEIKKKKNEVVNLKDYPAQLVQLTKMITEI
jgi:hypothetical protein